MKEHPDYKYRPRRKPKTLVKSPTPSNQIKDHQQQQHHQQQQQQHHQQKYQFGQPLDLIGLPRTPSFSLPHYSSLDPAFAFDLQARLQAMYANGLYHPWRYLGCPPVQSPETPPSPATPISYVCVKNSKTSPIQTQTPPNII